LIIKGRERRKLFENKPYFVEIQSAAQSDGGGSRVRLRTLLEVSAKLHGVKAVGKSGSFHKSETTNESLVSRDGDKNSFLIKGIKLKMIS